MTPTSVPPSAFGAALQSIVTQGFVDRRDAGRLLAEQMKPFRSQDALVLGIHRGGVAVAAEIARFLQAELDVLIARKVGAPMRPELALGAVTADGARFTNTALVRAVGISYRLFRILADEQRAEARRVEHRLREGRPPSRIAGRTVIVTDDGLATGATMRAALRSVRRAGPAHVVVAVPVGAPATCASLCREADELICLLAPDPFLAVGVYFENFTPIDHDAVQRLLAERASERPTNELGLRVIG